MEGRLAEAATANANATRNAMFCDLAAMPPTMASAPITITVVRATRSSASGLALPRLMTEL
ncbi:Uncharacterised protein [Mycobacteroides abscessus subsp. abscessus]|nr:Uncharacterised protein [Mycobacteroides abscessus subsp. abscessus]